MVTGAVSERVRPVVRRTPPLRGARISPRLVVSVLVLLTALVRLRLLGAPLSSDEAGFLTVGGQWSPGRSLYGDYWVDRPPGLVALTGLAQLAGGGVALRLLGAAAAAAAVVAAALLGKRLAPGHRWSAPACAGLAAALLSNPLLAVREVNGEVLALPFVLLGTWMLCAWFQDGRGAWAAGAGAMAVAAASVKQSMVDVVVLAVLLTLALLTGRRWRRASGGALLFGAGAGVLAAALLVLARSRGTDLTGLWDAVLVFRWEASRVIATEASPATGRRAGMLALAFVGTGAPVVLLLLARLPWRPRHSPDRVGVALTWVAAALLGWEATVVVMGGSYWLHYLVALVPGLVVLLALALRARARRPAPAVPTAPTAVDARARRTLRGSPLVLALVAVTASTVVGQVVYSVRPPQRPADAQAVVDFLRAHDGVAPTGVVAFGSAELLEAAGLHSPYRHLWSLPVRVRDPGLLQLEEVLRGAERPTWIVRQGASLTSWGIDARGADRIVERHYEEVFTSGDWQVLQLRPASSGGGRAAGVASSPLRSWSGRGAPDQ